MTAVDAEGLGSRSCDLYCAALAFDLAIHDDIDLLATNINKGRCVSHWLLESRKLGDDNDRNVV
jgi:hypothetical protein